MHIKPCLYLQTVCRDELIRGDERCRDIMDDAKVFFMSMQNRVPYERQLTLPRKSYAGSIFICIVVSR